MPSFTKYLSARYASIFPIPLVKQYLRLDNADDDAMVQMAINSAEEYATNSTNIVFSRRNLTCDITTIMQQTNIITLTPLLTLNSLTVDGVRLAVVNYSFTIDNYLCLPNIKAGKIVISADFGYPAIANIPNDLKSAIFTHAAYLYDNRIGGNTAVPAICSSVYNGYRIAKLT
jgi:hypothetical protein